MRMKLQYTLGALLLLSTAVSARDDWNDGRPNVCDASTTPNLSRCRQWIANAKMPDHRETSCCGMGDAYVADSYELKDGQLFAIISRDYPMVPKGTRIAIPRSKMNIAALDGGNPSGHGVVFMTAYEESPGMLIYNVYCYFGPTLS